MTGRRALALALGILAALAPGTAPAAPTDAELDAQILELRSLLRERRYPLALESLRLLARSVQDLRLGEVTPAFPEPPPGWTSTPAVSLGADEDPWSRRIEARREYRRADGAARISLTIDVDSPMAPTVSRALNPLFVAGDPLARLVDVGGEPALVRFAPDTGDAELRLLLGRDVLVAGSGRGLTSAEILVELARRTDLDLLRTRASRPK